MAYSRAMDRRIRHAGLAVAVAVVITGCASTQPTVPGKYDQTWTTDYAATTCADWDTQMDAHQRWVAAADMLVGGRKEWGIKTMPADPLVDTFEGDITQGCEPVPTLIISDAAASLLVIGGRSQYGS